MTSTVATEIPQTAPSAKIQLETWGKNERMRHVPAASWILRKVDGDLRRRIDIVCSSFDHMDASDPHRGAAEQALTALCRSLDRLAEAAKHGRQPGHAPHELTGRIHEALQHAVVSLKSLDEALFGRRYPFQTLERSKAEPLVGALLILIQALERAVVAMRRADPGLDERLLEGLVTLQEPLREQPIAS